MRTLKFIVDLKAKILSDVLIFLYFYNYYLYRLTASHWTHKFDRGLFELRNWFICQSKGTKLFFAGRDQDRKIIFCGTGLGLSGQRDRQKTGQNGIPGFFSLIENYYPSIIFVGIFFEFFGVFWFFGFFVFFFQNRLLPRVIKLRPIKIETRIRSSKWKLEIKTRNRNQNSGTGGTAKHIFVRDGTGQGLKLKKINGRDMSRPFTSPV